MPSARLHPRLHPRLRWRRVSVSRRTSVCRLLLARGEHDAALQLCDRALRVAPKPEQREKLGELRREIVEKKQA